MFCNKCGKELNRDDKFCSRCGSRVQQENSFEYEEVIFNPPFKVEAEQAAIKEEEVHIQQSPEKKKFATIDFSWDVSAYPTEETIKSNSKPRDVVFDWSSPIGAKKVVEPAPEEEEPKTEDVQAMTTEETTVEEAFRPQEDQLQAVAFEDAPKKDEFEDLIIDTPTVLEDAMPEGNGITVEEFLEELKNHKSREERKREEDEKAHQEEGDLEEATEEPKKGFLSFLKGAFTEPKQEEETLMKTDESAESPVEEPTDELTEEPLEQTIEEPAEDTEEKPFEEVIIPLDVAKDTASEEEEETDGIETAQVIEEEPKVPITNEINQFLPENQREETSCEDSMDATRIVDKFYTFNKKNVEFQQLLDQEYEKIRGDKSLDEIKAEVKKTNQEANELAKIVLEKKESGELDAKENKPNWDDIFGEDIEEQPQKKKSKAGKVVTTILLIIAIIAGGSYGVLKLFPGTEAADIIQGVIQKTMALIVPSNNPGEESNETVQTYIDNQIASNKNIGMVKYDAGLAVDMNRDYSTPGVKDSQTFVNSNFVNDKGDKVSYGDEIVRQLIGHYSDQAGKLANEKMTSLSIGKLRVSDQGFFVITSYQLEDTKNGNIENYKELIYLSINGNQVLIDNIEKL